jgi:hypothetical protein
VFSPEELSALVADLRSTGVAKCHEDVSTFRTHHAKRPLSTKLVLEPETFELEF